MIPASKKIGSAIAGLLVCLALVVAGCGSGGSGPTLTKAEFIQQGDLICKKTETKKGAEIEQFILKQGEKALTLKQQEEVATKIILPNLKTEGDELASLNAPDASKDEGSAIIEEFNEVVGNLEENPLPLASGKTDPFTNVAQRAGKYGFKTCILYY